MGPQKLSIYAVGDIIPDRADPEFLFALALPTLKKADILFGQLEANLSEKGEPQVQMPYTPRRISPKKVSGLTSAGFHVMSFASNHTLDLGEQALLETIDTLTKNNIAVIGVGKNIEEARRPAIFERKGVRVAFLAYCSVLPAGYQATANRSGCAPVRASTFYEQVDFQPGTSPKIITLADRDDLAAMAADIKNARQIADLVIMSIHWGIHFVPATIAMYQREVGHAAIDSGVDLVLGHHAHILKGIEVYKGKVIFHGLCNFALPLKPSRSATMPFQGLRDVKPDPAYPEYAAPVDSRKTIIAKCVITDKKIEKVSYLPVMINGQAQPEVLPRSDKRSADVFSYLEYCCREPGFDTRFEWEGDEVCIRT